MPYMVESEQVRGGLAKVRTVAAEHEPSSDAVSAALFAWTAVDAHWPPGIRCRPDSTRRRAYNLFEYYV